MATGKVCSKCGKRNHLSCVCRSSKQTDVAKTADKLVDEANWACSVSQGTELHSPSDTYPLVIIKILRIKNLVLQKMILKR